VGKWRNGGVDSSRIGGDQTFDAQDFERCSDKVQRRADKVTDELPDVGRQPLIAAWRFRQHAERRETQRLGRNQAVVLVHTTSFLRSRLSHYAILRSRLSHYAFLRSRLLHYARIAGAFTVGRVRPSVSAG